jgi:hypothetical protein
MCNCQMLKIVFSAVNIKRNRCCPFESCLFFTLFVSHPRGQNTPHTYHSIPHRTKPKKSSA